MKHIKIKESDLSTEFNKFSVRDEVVNFNTAKFELKHERYGYYYFINYFQYDELISNEGDIHGFDGVFIKNNLVYFYEAKYRSSGFLEAYNKAIKTIVDPKETRTAQIKNSGKFIKLKQGSTHEISFLDGLLKNIRDKKPLNVPKSRMVVNIGSHKDFSKVSKETVSRLTSVKETLVVEYE